MYDEKCTLKYSEIGGPPPPTLRARVEALEIFKLLYLFYPLTDFDDFLSELKRRFQSFFCTSNERDWISRHKVTTV